MFHLREWAEEGGVRVFEECTKLCYEFLGLQNSVEGVDIRDAVCCHERTVEDDVVPRVSLWMVRMMSWVCSG